MSAANDPRHTLLDLPMGGPCWPDGQHGARLVWQPMIRRLAEHEPRFFIHGIEDYEPAVFYDERDLVRFCLAVLALVSIRDDDKLRDQVAQILKTLVTP